MKSKFKPIIFVVAAILVLTLSLALLVACGETASPETSNKGSVEQGNVSGPSSGSSSKLPSGQGFAPSVDGLPAAKTITEAEYFQKFGELANSIGATAIEKGADLYFHSEMSGVFGLKKESGENDEHFELGFELEAILDRTSKDAAGEFTSENSAIRARAFSGDTDIFAASFFVNDPLNLYIDFAGSHIKLSAEFLYGDSSLNSLLGKAIGKALNKEFHFDFKRFDFDISLNKILDAIVEGTGSDWSPAALLKSLAKLIGLQDDESASVPEDEFDASFLTSMLEGTFKATKRGSEYGVVLDTRDTNVLVRLFFGGLLGVDMLFKMNFTEDNGRLKDGVRFEFGLPTLLSDDGRYPYAGINVNLLELLPVEGKYIHMAADKEDYKGDIAFKTEEKFSPKGFTLFGSQLREVRYSEAFRLDLVNPLATNETAAQIRLSLVDDEQNEDVVFDVSFVGGRLAVKLDPKVIFKQGTLIGDACRSALEFALEKLRDISPELEGKIADAAYVGGKDGAREQINENFSGIVVENVGVKEILTSFISRAADAFEKFEDLPMPEMPELPAQPEEGDPWEDWQMPDFSELQKYSPASIMQKRIFPALGRFIDLFDELSDGRIVVHSDNILELLLNISNDLAGLEGSDRLTQSELFDEAISGACSALDWLAENGFIAYDEQNPDALSLMDDCFKALLDAFKIKDAPQKLEDESYTKYALRVLLGSVSLDFTLDLNDGWRYSATFGIAGATLSYEYSFTAWDGLDVKDLYDDAQSGWLLFDFADAENFIK